MNASFSVFSAIILMLATSPALSAAQPDYLTYDKFIAEVESGSVKTVSLDRFSQITGTYSVDGAERVFRSYGDTGSANDVLLIRLLRQNNVATTLREQQEKSIFFDGSWMTIPYFLAPFLTLILVFRINSKFNRLAKERTQGASSDP